MAVGLKMRWTVITTAIGLSAEGLGSAFLGPGADLAIITTAWVAMITTLAYQASIDMDKVTALKIVSAILLAFGSFVGGTKLAVQAFALTGVGTLPAMISNCGINGVVTYLTGMAVAAMFVETREVESVEAFARAVVSAVLGSFGIGPSDNPSA